MTTQMDAPVSTGATNIVELTESDRQTVRRLTSVLTTEPLALIDSLEWVRQAAELSCELPLHLREALRRFRRYPGPAAVLLVRGLPVDSDDLPPTPSVPGSVELHPTSPAAALALVSLHLGDITAFRQEKGGALVQNVVPVPGQEDFQGNAGSAALTMHVENAFHTHRPDYVALSCLRNDHDDIAGLRTASIRAALPLLSPETRTVLGEPRFVTDAPPSFGDSVPSAKPCGVLQGSPEDPDIVVDFHATQPLDEVATAAFRELGQALDHVANTFVLRPGDLAITDNRLALHGRTAFRPRYDGRDRWLQRTYVHLDPRRTRPFRDGNGNVLA
jgi:L-asparagine oxygenase